MSSASAQHTARPRPVLIDCDPGHDDAIAILMAAALPQLEVVAITTVAGNQTLEKTTRNARVVCGLAGLMSLPIAAGADRPLVRTPVHAAAVHGETGMDGPPLDGEQAPLDPRHAVDVIIDTAATSPDPLTLVAIGPLTNIAMALRLEPSLASHVDAIYMMGGAIGAGNHTPSAEFNVYADPHAASVVFSSRIPIRMAGLELTRHAAITDAVVQRVVSLRSPVGDFVGEILDFYRASFRRRHGYDGAPIYDACAVAWLAMPQLVTSKSMHVVVDTAPGPSLGRTSCDADGVLGLPPNADVGLRIETDEFWDLAIDALAGYQ